MKVKEKENPLGIVNQVSAKPFVKWVGGKTQLISTIETNLPKELKTVKEFTYIEPFVGGGAVLFWILQQFPNITKAVINDINSDLTNAYKTIKNNPLGLISILKEIQKEYLLLNEEKRKEYFLNKRDRFNTKSLDSIENAALFLFLNRTCFNGLYRVNSKGLFNVPFGKYTNPTICDEKTILADSELLQKVEIFQGDFTKMIEFADKNVFYYLDPPYKPLNETSSFTSYTLENFNDDDQIRLKDFCEKIDSKGAWWILSNSDVKSKNPNDNFFDDIYSKYNIKRVLAKRSVNANPLKRGVLNELMISNI